MDSTHRLALPLIMPGQAQKEMSHNEALQVLDTLVAAAVEDIAANDPPAEPGIGQSYLLSDSPSGEWSQYPSHIASFTNAGWRFVAPVAGMLVLVKSTGTFAVYGSAGWDAGTVRASRILVNENQVVGERGPGISDPAGGATVDAEARTTLAEILAALRQHGLIYS